MPPPRPPSGRVADRAGRVQAWILAPLFLTGWFLLKAADTERFPARAPGTVYAPYASAPSSASPARALPTVAALENGALVRTPLAIIAGSVSANRDAETISASISATTPAEGQAEIRIVVTSEQRPVPGAHVEIGFTPGGADDQIVRVFKADAKGRVRALFGRPGTECSGTLRIVGWDRRMAGGPLFVELRPAESATHELALTLTYQVAGRVLDADTGLPVEDATVSFWTFSERDTVRTQADGSFLHDRFPDSKFAEQIHVTAPGYGAAIRYLTIAPDGSWELPGALPTEPTRSGTGTPFVECFLVPEVRILGRVLDGKGMPVAGASVIAEGYYRIRPDVASRDWKRTLTDDGGVFELEGLRSDVSHNVVVRATGFAQAASEVQRHSAGLHDLGDLRLERELVLSGVILDADGRPVEDIEVRLLRSDAKTGSLRDAPDSRDVAVRIEGTVLEQRTPRGGTFLFEHLRDVPYRLSVHRENRALLTHDLGPGVLVTSNSIELSLPPEYITLEGELKGIPGSPEGAVVEARRRGHIARVSVAADGRFRIAGLDDAAPYTLLATFVPGPASEAGTIDRRAPEAALSAGIEAWSFEKPVLRMKRSADTTGPMLARNEPR